MAHWWRSEDSLQESAIDFSPCGSQISNSGFEFCPQFLLPPVLSHQCNTNFLYGSPQLDESLCSPFSGSGLDIRTLGLVLFRQAALMELNPSLRFSLSILSSQRKFFLLFNFIS